MAVKSNLKNQLSMQSWKWRTARLVGVAVGSLTMVAGLEPNTSWSEFPSLLTPLVALGLIGNLASAVMTSGDTPAASEADPATEGGDS